MHYVYILQSKKDGSYYTGSTKDVLKRLLEHNSGVSVYSSSKRPFKLIWYCAFGDKTKALAFEKYLKQGPGFAFARKHLVYSWDGRERETARVLNQRAINV
ncbi:MAG: excinuclease ABC subunit C domain-containing protein [Parcubacteria group bacterium Greene0416_79]|nr:MAG: excinuclease ABC subunit C domain-containing protein [Parcubacteria group bacterium Greene0416_79]